MLPGPLAPIDAHRARALTTIYAPRKLKQKKHKTAQTRMLDDVPIKPTISPFHPLPAIGQKPEENSTKVIVLDLKNDAIKLHDVLKPLTPLSIHGFKRKDSLECIQKKPQQLIRENTYDVIEPIFVTAAKLKKDRKNPEKCPEKVSPKTRFKNAALQVAKLSSMPETGKLLCLRERETFTVCRENSCKLQRLPQSPVEKLNKLSEIFQNLELKGRQRDKLKKENSWF